jgi:hypothetical protein
MTDDSDTSLDVDERFDLLCNARRLNLLEYLYRQDDPVHLTQAATYIAARENDKSVQELTEDERRRAYISLYQTHLPLLVKHDVIHWNETTNTVEIADAGELLPYLDAEQTDGFRWGPIHLVLTVAALSGVTLAIPGLFPFSLLPITGYAVLLSVLTLGLATYRFYRQGDSFGVIPTLVG